MFNPFPFKFFGLWKVKILKEKVHPAKIYNWQFRKYLKTSLNVYIVILFFKDICFYWNKLMSLEMSVYISAINNK